MFRFCRAVCSNKRFLPTVGRGKGRCHAASALVSGQPSRIVVRTVATVHETGARSPVDQKTSSLLALAGRSRARMALTVSGYAAQSFDQDLWMKRESGLDGRSAANAYLSTSRMNRAFFQTLSEADLATSFSHPEYGSLTLDWIRHQTAGHQLHHLKQLEAISRQA